MTDRIRLLDLLSDRYPDVGRGELLARIVCGEAIINGERLRDPHERVASDVTATFCTPRYVGRGGYKLEHAIRSWDLIVDGRTFLDAGSSTGGFTDCLLQHGARAVHAVDAGYNQLDYRLRRDARVFVHERTRVETITALDPVPDAAVADLSLASLADVTAGMLALTRERWGVLLVKPQYEWRSPSDEFDGTVPRDELAPILIDLLYRLRSSGVFCSRCVPSPIAGRKGNTEFFALVSLGEEAARSVEETVERVLASL
jgi:23S rRNA (cytidine1920-2'-O)/16S rRNA (cytidine1409-2'-O)-methyltransferase